MSIAYWTKVLEASEAAILEFAAAGYATMTVGDKSITFKRLPELMALRDRAVAEVARATTGQSGTIVRARFGGAS